MSKLNTQAFAAPFTECHLEFATFASNPAFWLKNEGVWEDPLSGMSTER
jgi:hypothetical protein